jgi:15-cis-phytoene synthase
MPARPEAPATRSLARLYTPPALRPLFGALCALEREIGASLRPELDHRVAHVRLAFWREECGRCAQGDARHPLTQEIATHAGPLARAALANLVGLVDCAQWDLAAATFETRRELVGYCERWSAAMIEPLARSAVPTAAADTACVLGRSLRELELLLAAAAEAHAGRIRLPLDELERAHATTAQLTHSPWPPALAHLARERHTRLRAALAAGVSQLGPAGQPPLRGLIVWTALAARHSVRAARHLPDARLARDSRRWLDGFCAWHVARRANEGRCHLPAH